MKEKQVNILFADDDVDDCFFFAKALKELPIKSNLHIVRDGNQLMNYLFKNMEQLPDVIFLDLNMPNKTGFECLQELKENIHLKDIPVVMLSTSYSRDLLYEHEIIKTLNGIGAASFIRKLADYAQIKNLIHIELNKVLENKSLKEQEKE